MRFLIVLCIWLTACAGSEEPGTGAPVDPIDEVPAIKEFLQKHSVTSQYLLKYTADELGDSIEALRAKLAILERGETALATIVELGQPGKEPGHTHVTDFAGLSPDQKERLEEASQFLGDNFENYVRDRDYRGRPTSFYTDMLEVIIAGDKMNIQVLHDSTEHTFFLAARYTYLRLEVLKQKRDSLARVIVEEARQEAGRRKARGRGEVDQNY